MPTQPTDPRRHLWDLDCLERDLVLATSFDWQELEAFCRGEGMDPGVSPEGLPRDYVTLALVHKACHEETPLATRIEGFLNQVHRHEIRLIATICPCVLERETMAREPEAIRDIPGFLWAVLSDPREGIRPVERHIVRRFWTAGARTLVSGAWTLASQRQRIRELEALVEERAKEPTAA